METVAVDSVYCVSQSETCKKVAFYRRGLRVPW